MKTKSRKEDKVNVITLGCSKNLVDSENIITQLRGNQIDAEHELYDDNANVIIVNTCGFIEAAKQESVDTILEYANLRSKGSIDKLYVTGCLSQRYKVELEKEIPEVDAYFGTMELPALLAKFNADYKHELIGERKISTLPHYAYVKISEGCNRKCSFCAIPVMRGKHISRSIEDIVKEVKNLATNGVKEIILIAQELTYYGLDIYRKRRLSDLLNKLSEVDGIEWIRLHYAYPSKFPMDVLETIAAQKKVCNYLDIPLQHADNAVLERMKRQITIEETEYLLSEARRLAPGIAIRTTFLVGFPGETEKEFQRLLNFIADQKFERVGVFCYSHEESTSAYALIDDIPSEIKENRKRLIMELQEEISFHKNQQLVGNTIKVLFDRKEGSYFIGRTEFDSPEVDNEILVDARQNFVRIGDFANIRITKAEEFDLYGELVQ